MFGKLRYCYCPRNLVSDFQDMVNHSSCHPQVYQSRCQNHSDKNEYSKTIQFFNGLFNESLKFQGSNQRPLIKGELI